MDNRVIGFTDGVYDMFHVGHLNLIKEGKKRCDYLIVGVHGDDVVESYKKHRPIINENERLCIIESVRYVDKAVINRFRDKIKLWELYHFNKLFIGDDWKGTPRWIEFEREFTKVEVEVVYLPYTKGVSTTEICNKILQSKANHV